MGGKTGFEKRPASSVKVRASTICSAVIFIFVDLRLCAESSFLTKNLFYKWCSCCHDCFKSAPTSRTVKSVPVHVCFDHARRETYDNNGTTDPTTSQPAEMPHYKPCSWTPHLVYLERRRQFRHMLHLYECSRLISIPRLLCPWSLATSYSSSDVCSRSAMDPHCHCHVTQG